MTDPTLPSDIARLAGTRILCVGDVMLDHYVYGQVERVSPEAPIPVLRVERETRTLGGAGNVLRNLQALGLSPCFVSVVGNDPAGHEVSRLAADRKSTRLNSSHPSTSYAVFCLKKKTI